MSDFFWGVLGSVCIWFMVLLMMAIIYASYRGGDHE